MLLPKWDMRDPWRWRVGSDFVEDTCLDRSDGTDGGLFKAGPWDGACVALASLLSLLMSLLDRFKGVTESLGATLQRKNFTWNQAEETDIYLDISFHLLLQRKVGKIQGNVNITLFNLNKQKIEQHFYNIFNRNTRILKQNTSQHCFFLPSQSFPEQHERSWCRWDWGGRRGGCG